MCNSSAQALVVLVKLASKKKNEPCKYTHAGDTDECIWSNETVRVSYIFDYLLDECSVSRIVAWCARDAKEVTWAMFLFFVSETEMRQKIFIIILFAFDRKSDEIGEHWLTPIMDNSIRHKISCKYNMHQDDHKYCKSRVRMHCYYLCFVCIVLRTITVAIPLGCFSLLCVRCDGVTFRLPENIEWNMQRTYNICEGCFTFGEKLR